MKNNRWFRKILALGTVILCLLSIQACSDESLQATPVIKEAVSDGLPADAPNYLVAVDATYAPLAFRDETGQAIGFDVDILTAIGKNQGFRLTFIPTLWDGIFSTLTNGERDIVAGGVTITPQRQQIMDMSKPYLDSPTLIVHTDTVRVQRFDDLQDLSVGVQADSVFEAKLRDLHDSNGSRNTYAEKSLFVAFKALLNGKVQAVIGDAPVLRYHLAEYHDLGKAFRRFEYTPDGQVDTFGFAVKQGNHALLNQINLGLRNIRADGEYDKIYAKWFQSTAGVP